MDKIHVACFFDRKLLYPAAVMAASIARYATNDRPVVLHAFCKGDFSAEFGHLTACLRSPAFDVLARPIGNPFDRKFSVAYFNPAYCARLCIGDHFADLERVLYLDVDTYVRGSLAPLYDLDIGDNIAAAARDSYIENLRNAADEPCLQLLTTQVNVKDYIRSCLDNVSTYFNSGVMLIDVRKWLDFGAKEKCLEFLNSHLSVLFSDQDALNVVLDGRVLHVSNEWNFLAEIEPAIDEKNQSPTIVHFAGNKPWSAQGLMKEYYDEYWEFVMRTPFGAILLEQFYSDVESRRSYVERCARSKIAAIPADARPLDLDWARLLPRPLLRRVAEFYCTFGKGRWNAVGLRLWHIYESRS